MSGNLQAYARQSVNDADYTAAAAFVNSNASRRTRSACLGCLIVGE
jgi:hypothetical protein